MAKLIYSMITSLDGYAEAAEGDLGAGADDVEVHTFVGDLFRPVGTYLYGRRMYETMVYWETAHAEPDQPPHILQYARDWQAAEGGLGTGADDPEVHTFVNDVFRPVGTYLYGRRMYETMVYWETAHTEPDQPPHVLQYASDWQAAEKVVYSTTLQSVSSERTSIERTFDPDAVLRLKEEADSDLTVDGPNLAAQAIAAGLVDEYHLFVTTTVVGGGKRFFPDGVRLDLDLVEERAFTSGLVYTRYRTR